jgi:hypothetical protein
MIKFIAGFMLGVVSTFFWVYLILSSLVESYQKEQQEKQKKVPQSETIEVQYVDLSCRRPTLKDI